MSKADASLLAADLCTQAERLRQGTVTAVELVKQHLVAIDASHESIHAYLHVDAEGALAVAAASDARRVRGEVRALEGVPIAVKDNIDAAGMVTTAGMATRRHNAPAAADSPAVAALRDAGAVLLGKLNMHEAAMGADNDNPHFGACHNPHRHGFTPGGSSGGSGAAVAAGLCAAALGTDTMGSVRIPASYCGVVGLKPGWGAISTRGTVPLCRRFDHIGPLARSARDLRLLLPVLVGFDPDCAQSRVSRFAASHEQALRLGVVDLHGLVDMDAEVQSAFEQGVARLRELGHHQVDLSAPNAPPGSARRAGLLMCETEMLVEHAEAWQNDRQALSPLLVKLMAWAENKPGSDLVRASLRVDEAQVQLQQWLQQCDVLLLPTAPQRAFEFGSPVPANQADLTSWANMAGCPALSLPLPVPAGELPIGMQLVGRFGSELQLIALAEAFQQAIGWQPTLPEACNPWWPR